MRKLQTSDVFELARLVKKINIKEELKEVAMKANADSDVYSVGFEMIFSLMEKFAENNSEEALYEFLSGPLEISKEEIKVMDPLDLVEKLSKIADIDRWKAFLKLAVR